MEQRWLSLDGIRSRLGLPNTTVKWWVKAGLIRKIGTGPQARYLDPTDEAVEQMRLAWISQTKDANATLPRDLTTACILTTREVAQIMGWTMKYAQVFLSAKKVPGHRNSKRTALFSVETVRNLLWRRRGRKTAARHDPFLLTELIEFFWREYEKDSAAMPTDAEFAEDADLRKKFELVMRMPSPQKERSLQQLLEKTELAKSITFALRGVSPSPAVEHQSSSASDRWSASPDGTLPL